MNKFNIFFLASVIKPNRSTSTIHPAAVCRSRRKRRKRPFEPCEKVRIVRQILSTLPMLQWIKSKQQHFFSYYPGSRQFRQTSSKNHSDQPTASSKLNTAVQKPMSGKFDFTDHLSFQSTFGWREKWSKIMRTTRVRNGGLNSHRPYVCVKLI